MTDNKSTDDKTRIAPRSRNVSAEEEQKTVIKTADDKTVLKVADDKTVLSPRVRDKAVAVDETVLKNDDKTRIASREPAKTSHQINTPIPPESFSDSLNDDSDEEERIINNRFVLKESLGAGGMAMVFRALDLRKHETGDSDPYIAIKILGRELEDHPQAFVTLQREAKKSQMLSHPNVIKVYDFDREGDLVYLTMEELKGRPLNKIIRENSQGLPPEIAMPIIAAIADGLAYAHERNIVHADLKPENIFYTDEGEVKIIDFGIARIITDLDTKGSGEQYDPDEVTGLTPAYASVEMFRDEAPVPSDDVYALGIISYELLTGEHPYKRNAADVAFEKGMTVKKLTHIRGYQWKAISKALLFERKSRFKSGTEFRNLFVGRGRMARNLTTGLVSISMIFVVSLFIPRDNNMDHLYDELAPAQQAKFDELMAEGNTLLGFDDWNNALSMFELAHEILPQHSTTQKSLDDAVLKIIESFERGSVELSHSEKLRQINQLLKYKSLAENESLNEYKAHLESGG